MCKSIDDVADVACGSIEPHLLAPVDRHWDNFIRLLGSSEGGLVHFYPQETCYLILTGKHIFSLLPYFLQPAVSQVSQNQPWMSCMHEGMYGCRECMDIRNRDKKEEVLTEEHIRVHEGSLGQRGGTINRDTPTLTCLYTNTHPHMHVHATLPTHTCTSERGKPFGKWSSNGINMWEPCTPH